MDNSAATHNNDGQPFSTQTLNALLADVAELFGGYSLDGPGRGAWIDDDGNVYDEPSFVLTVACPRDDYALARQLVSDIGRRLGQRTMYFEVRYFDGVEIIPLD